MNKYIDSHAHLFDKVFSEDIDAVVERAKETGVEAALVVAITPDDFGDVLKGADRFPNFWLPCLGVHPVQGAAPDTQRCVTEEDLALAEPWIHEHHEKLIAIGEVGLDFSPRFAKADEDKEIQRKVLRRQIELAKQYDLPLNVHSRSAGRPTVALLRESAATKVLLHAFDGRPAVALEAVQAGYYLSIPPSIVRSEQKQKLVERVPLDHLLLETDSPALGPQKQVRNEPSNISIACDYVARVKRMDRTEVAKVMWENTLKVFPRLARHLKS